jgi:hypothetical protein
MATAVIASASWTADGFDYVLDLEEEGATPDTNDITIISPIVMRCGDENGEPLPGVRVRTLSMRIRDEALFIQGRITAEGGNKHYLHLTRDGDTLFWGHVDNRFQSYLSWHTNPEMELSAFDGLELLDGIPWLQSGDKTLRATLYAALSGLGLPINIVMPWKHDGADASTEPPDALRWRSEDWLGDNSTYLDALRELCGAFNADCFQRGGEWWFVQRSSRGDVLTVYPTDTSGTAGTATTYDPVYVATNETLLRERTSVIEHAPTSLVTIRQEWVDRGLRNGGFELLNARFWKLGGTGGFLASPAGGWTMDTSGEYIEQEVGHTLMALSATRDKLVVHLDFSFVIDSSASGTATVGNAFMDYLEVQLTEADGTILYDDGAGSWTGTQTYIQYPFLLASLAGTTVEEADLTHTTPVPPSSPCKIRVRFIFQSNPNSDGDYINSLTVNRAWVGHARPDKQDDIDRPDGFTYVQGNTLGGEHLEQDFILGDMYDRHLVPGVMQYYDGADWQFTTDWDGLGQKFHKKRLTDLTDQLSARLPGYSFGHVWGEEVDILSTIEYNPGNVEPWYVHIPVFEERIIHPVGKHSVRTAAYQLAGVERFASSVFMGLSNNGETGDTTSGIYSLDEDFDMASFQLRLATASRPRIIVPLNSRRQLLYQLEGDAGKIYRVDIATFGAPVEWLDVSPDEIEGIAVNELGEEVIVTVDDSVTGLNDRLIVYDYDGTSLRSANNPPITVNTGCPGVDSANRRIYMRHGPGVTAVTRFDLDTLAYENSEDTYVYGGMGPVEYNSVDNRLYWFIVGTDLDILTKTPSGGLGGDVRLYDGPGAAFVQMYYSKLHGELLVGSGVGLRLPPTGTDVSGTAILTGLDIGPGCSGICVYEPNGGHTA